ncbi:MAG: tRNA pseudouridine(38-40) synthase TruA [Pyrinomonadaceae bacterium]
MNFRLLIQYDGTDFHGWQVQENAPTIQGELERVIGIIEDGEVKVAGSGRTDAGVHAEGQVANVHLKRPFTPDRLRAAINGNLSRDIRIMQAASVSDDFHARFSATGKTYVYRIVNAPVMSPFARRFAHQEVRPLDVSRMAAAAHFYLGEHDWTAFSSAQADGENRVRTITEASIESLSVERLGGRLIQFRISANGFLRYMVRSIVGTLLEIGRGEKDPQAIQTAISTGDRNLAGPTAAANGLTLLKVFYD